MSSSNCEICMQPNEILIPMVDQEGRKLLMCPSCSAKQFDESRDRYLGIESKDSVEKNGTHGRAIGEKKV